MWVKLCMIRHIPIFRFGISRSISTTISISKKIQRRIEMGVSLRTTDCDGRFGRCWRDGSQSHRSVSTRPARSVSRLHRSNSRLHRHKQYRLEDSTLVRPFPQKWTLWADDLYMRCFVSLAHGRIDRRSRYFDDAAKQVVNFHKHLLISQGDDGALLVLRRKPSGRCFWGGQRWAMMAQVNFAGPSAEKLSDADTLMLCSGGIFLASPGGKANRACGTSCSIKRTRFSKPPAVRCLSTPLHGV